MKGRNGATRTWRETWVAARGFLGWSIPLTEQRGEGETKGNRPIPRMALRREFNRKASCPRIPTFSTYEDHGNTGLMRDDVLSSLSSSFWEFFPLPVWIIEWERRTVEEGIILTIAVIGPTTQWNAMLSRYCSARRLSAAVSGDAPMRCISLLGAFTGRQECT